MVESALLKIAISGKMGSGKTTLAEEIRKQFTEGYNGHSAMVSLGAPVKEVARNYFLMPADVKVVTLLKRKKDSPPVDHFCFEIDDEWVVGYGLDDNSLKRNYRNIYKIN